jgi:stage V sporulation protein D (sporulation-specific penicillin-binding protein)
MLPEERTRLRIIVGIVLLLGVFFIVRLYYLQIIHGKDFKAEAESQYVSAIPDLYDRGSIFFQQKDGKRVAAATISSGYVIAIIPKEIEDKEKVFAAISRATAIDRDSFMKKAGKTDDPYEEVSERVPEKEAKALLKEELPGVRIFRQTWRTYPAGSLAAPVIGFVGYKDNELSGRYGLESYYNDVLSRNEQDLYVNFFAELFTNLSDTIFDRNEEENGDLVLTIEPTVQAYLEGELGGIMKEWNSDETGGIIMDPKTGAIYAMAVNPSFDLNQYGKVKEQRLFANPLVQDVYEMGSIVKPITMAAGLDSGAVTEKSTYNDTGHMTLNGKTFGNYDGKGRGPGTTMQLVLNDSLNTGVAHIVSRMGNENFKDYLLNKFHIGEETGIDLPGERQGLTSNLNSKRDIEFATASFGQGIALSPINMTVSLAMLGNGGYAVTPHVVDKIEYTSGKIKEFTPNPPEMMLAPGTSERITRMLVNVVDKALLNGTVKIPEYTIAAKTGTAQIYDPKGGYYTDRYMHTFFGYFPAYDPKFIVFLYTYYPKNDATFASHTLTMPFIRTSKFLLHYYNIPPDRADVLGAQLTMPHAVTMTY